MHRAHSLCHADERKTKNEFVFVKIRPIFSNFCRKSYPGVAGGTDVNGASSQLFRRFTEQSTAVSRNFADQNRHFGAGRKFVPGETAN